jgi:Bifunctional DNA primase/polymerase, N-terminal/Primase C terminal 1 (PriCT-1)
VIVVDIDPRHEGNETLAERERDNGPLPDTWETLTGGGGRHLWFRHPGIARIPNSAGVIGPGIDVRGDGGFVVAPPSIHESGRRYAWDVDHHPDDETLADLPAWMVARIDHPRIAAPAAAADQWRALAYAEVSEGRRNATLAKLAGHLLRRYVDHHVVLTVLLGWNSRSCKPPLEEGEIIATVTSIVQREAARREARNAA